jgi:hypothetical protein
MSRCLAVLVNDGQLVSADVCVCVCVWGGGSVSGKINENEWVRG